MTGTGGVKRVLGRTTAIRLKTVAARLGTACGTRLLPLLLLLSLPAVVQGQWQYITDNGAITITGYTGSGGAVTIPSTITGLPVTSIGNSAFSYCTNLTSVTIPASVTSIGHYAFNRCSSLASVAIHDNATIPASDTSMGTNVFSWCQHLASVTIGNGVTNIGDNAFYQCNSLTNITIGTNVTSIGYLAFQACLNLTSLTIPDSVTSIGGYAFEDCYGLTSVTINNVTNIGMWAFYGCWSLANVTIGSGVSSIGNGAFYDCWDLTSVRIGNGISSIGSSAFGRCSKLADLTFPSSVTNIGTGAFGGCYGLSYVFFQGNAPVDSNAFDRYLIVFYLRGATGWGPTFSGFPTAIWDSPTQFGYTTNGNTASIAAYLGAASVVAFPDSLNGFQVTSIGTNAFRYSWVLANVAIPDSVTNIGMFAFDECQRLTNATIGNGVTRIGSYAFNSCHELTSVTIGNSLSSIGDNAFRGCYNLTSVTLPKNLTWIQDLAFGDCTGLKAVYFEGNAPSIGASIFTNDVKTTVYYLPGTTGWGPTFGGRPTALWQPQAQVGGTSFGVRTNRFGFNINWAVGQTVVVETCENLADPTWSPVSTNTLTGGWSYFSDPQWTNYPARLYRLRSP
jgi:hypothetical protein